MYQQSARTRARVRGRALVRGPLPLLGPAFVTAIAYVDPGNFATNVTAGSTYGYLLVWVVIVSNLMAMLIQYLAAKAGIATGQSLPEMCRENLPRPVVRGLWLQGEVVAVATDLAEVVGGALALKILFDLPLLVGGTITALVAFALLVLQNRGHRPFEVAITGLLGGDPAGLRLRRAAQRRAAARARRGRRPPLRGQRLGAAGRRHARGDGDAARDLAARLADHPALRALHRGASAARCCPASAPT